MLPLLLSAAFAATTLRYGVLVDAEQGRVVIAVDGGVEARAAGSGRALWRTDAAAVPLDARGDLVAAWAAAPAHLAIVGLDARRGGRIAVRCAPLWLPAWASGDPRPRLGGSTTVRLKIASGGDIRAAWSAETHYAGGAPPPPEILQAAARDASGSGRCAHATGEWSADAGPPETGRPGFMIDENSGIPDGIWRGGQFYTLVRTDAATTIAYALERWDPDTKQRASSVPLGEFPSDGTFYTIFSADAERVAIVSGQTSAVYDLAGARLYEVPARLASFVEVGDGVVYAEGNVVREIGRDGRLRWEAPVRSFNYEGPYPP